MIEDIEVSRGKSVGELGHEAFWFAAHTVIAVLALAGGLAAASFASTELRSSFGAENTSDYYTAQLIFTGVAFVLPMIVGFAIAKAKHNDIARYVWISGLLIFSVICVWVLGLPTGPGMCEHCGALEKLVRTFFDIKHGSGLMGEEGLLIGTWIPLSMIGYAVGAKFGLDM
jgi:hypothetical protein